MIFDLMRNGLSLELLINLCVRVFVIFCVLPIHEFAHGFVAYKLGDNTAKLKGRLTMNPLAHVDPLGALMVLLVGFGYAKPVPVNIGRFKRGKRKQYYYEHFGMMDNPDYAERAIRRIELYESNGIFPGDQLLCSWETKAHPLDMKLVDAMIKKYLI